MAAWFSRTLPALGRMLAYWHENGTRRFADLLLRKAGLFRMIATASGGETAAPDVSEVVFLNGCPVGQSQRYRIFNQIEMLERHGYRAACLEMSARDRLFEMKPAPWTVVIFRATWDDGDDWYERFFKWAGQQSVRVVYDIDDLIFEPDVVPLIHAYHTLGARQRRAYMKGVLARKRLLLTCHSATASTEILCEAIAAMGIPTVCIPNTLNFTQLQHADHLLARAKPRAGFKIAYLSGSRTHEADFAVAEPALKQFLKTHSDARLQVVGYLKLNSGWKKLEKQIDRMPIIDPLSLLDITHACDVTIAPLEAGNLFCEAKSELKYFESAVVGVPLIASATSLYDNIIRSGYNGYTAATSEDWLLRLEQAYGDHDNVLGQVARADAIRKYGPDVTLDTTIRAYLGDRPDRDASAAAMRWPDAHH